MRKFLLFLTMLLCGVLLGCALRLPIAANAGTATKTPTQAAFARDDQELIAFISNRQGYPSVYTMTPDGRNVRLIARGGNPSGFRYPIWSPDGKQLAFSGISDVEIFDLMTSQIRILAHSDREILCFDWSPDGKQLACNDFGLILINVADGSFTRFTSDAGLNRAEWSPDGKLLAFTLDSISSVDGDLHVIGADAANPKTLTQSAIVIAFVWSGNDAILFSSEGWISSIGPSGDNFHNLTSGFIPRVSPDGKSVAYIQDDGKVGFQVFVMDADGKNQRQLTDAQNVYLAGDDTWLAWSPDGKQIIYPVVYNPADIAKKDDLYIVNADGSHPHLATPHIPFANNTQPAWRPLPQTSTR
jgi:Tol biopolymer transport system component